MLFHHFDTLNIHAEYKHAISESTKPKRPQTEEEETKGHKMQQQTFTDEMDMIKQAIRSRLNCNF